MSEDPDLHFDLEANARDSLSHAVDHFLDAKENGEAADLKYTILHAFHATELYLKARLAQAHPSLIFQRPEDAHKEDPKTVDFETLIARLKSVSVALEDSEKDDLNHLRKIRNRIEHHKVSFKVDEAEDFVGRAMRFLSKFLKDELNISLEEILDAKKYKTLEEALFSYEERVKNAVERASEGQPIGKDAIDWQLIDCIECGEQTVCPSPEEDQRYRCHFCDERFYANSCTRCGTAILYSRKSADDDLSFECDGCVDYRMSRDD